MLPIPERIIGSRRLFFIPLAYVGVTVTLCYYFVLAFVHMPRIPIANANSQQEQRQLTTHLQQQQLQQDLKSSPVKESSEEEAVEIPPGSIPQQENNIFIGESAEDTLLPLTVNKNKEDPLLLPSLTVDTKERQPSVKTLTKSWKDQVEGEGLEEEEKEDRLSQNGTRRSEPSKIWSSHQDSPDWIDWTSPMHFPWPNDDDCKQLSVRFAKKQTFRPTALVSFPGSGNSWLRYLVEGSTGIFTGSIFNDVSLYNSGLLGEMRSPVDGSTLLQKTHDNSLVIMKTGEVFKKMTELVFKYRGILLIRNPYDALQSYWNFHKTRDHKGHASNQSFHLHQWKSFVETGSKKWAQLIQDWLENSQDLLLVLYEDLKKNPKEELLRIANYFGLPLDNSRLACVLKYVKGPFKRDHSVKTKVKQSFTSSSSHLDLIVQENIEHVNRILAIKDIPLRLNYTLN